MKPIPRAYCDIDGVLARWIASVLHLFTSIHTEQENSTEHVGDLLGVSNNKVWELINAAGEDFWTGLEKYPWADDLIDAVRDYDPHFAFLTSPGHSPVAASGKIKWLERYYPKDYKRFILTGLKESCSAPGRVLIDDSEAYEEGWVGQGGTYILVPRPWNRLRTITHDGDIRAYLLEAINTL